VKKAVKAVESKEVGNGADLTATAVSLLDRATTKGVLHRNTAARQKSRLMKRLNKSAAE
jgi:small subunit ribosomal protein S20